MVHVMLRDPPAETHARRVRGNDAADDLVLKAVAGDLGVAGVMGDEPIGNARSLAGRPPQYSRNGRGGG